MTKNEAIELLKQGFILTHQYFSSDEWVAQFTSDLYIFEDGVRHSVKDFWRCREGLGFDTGWSIIKKSSLEKTLEEIDLNETVS